MSFDSDEKSVSSSRPRELWLIETPTTTYRYTTAEVDVDYDSHTWTAIPGARSEVGGSSLGDPQDFTLSLPASNPFVQAHAFGMPPQQITLTVYRLQGSAVLTWWRGEISDFTVAKGDAKVRSPSNLADALDGTIPSANVQKQCNHMLYDARCTVDKNNVANKLATTVTSISTDGLEITVASVGALGDHLVGGELKRDADSDNRLILKRAGLVITVSAPYRALAPGDAVTLFRGCKHDITDCVVTFNNAINFGGHPYVPPVNPFAHDIRGYPFI